MSSQIDWKPVAVVFLDHENGDLSVEKFNSKEAALAAIQNDEDNRKAILLEGKTRDSRAPWIDVDYHT